MKKVDKNESVEIVEVEEGVGPISAVETEIVLPEVEVKEEDDSISVAVIALTNLKYGELKISIGQKFDILKTEFEEFTSRGLVE